MSSRPNKFQHIALITKPDDPRLLENLLILQRFLISKGLAVHAGPNTAQLLDVKNGNTPDRSAGDCDLAIVVGGDGTMLNAARELVEHDVPIVGVNLGRLGFLIQVQQNEWREMFKRLFNGDAWMENRMMLRVEHVRAGEILGSWQALNEAVVARGQYLRPVKLAASADGHLLTTYIADGLIAATATGSTAYALAAGGPILPPELRNILIVPIAPHLSVDRAVVLAEGSSISIDVKSENAVLSVDGAFPTGLAEDDRVDVRAAEYTAHFVRFGDAGYFYRNLTAHMNQNPAIGMTR